MPRVLFVAATLALTACATRVHRVQVGDVEVATFRRSYNNAHLVWTTEGTVLVDAGLERDAPALARDLGRVGVGPGDLDLVVLTHGHADHAGGAGWFRSAWGVPVLAGAGDADLLASGHNDPLCPTDRTARRRLAAAQAETFTAFTPDHLVDAPMDLGALGLRGRVLPVTGHTAGSLALDLGGAVFVGDLVRGGITSRRATGHFFQCAPALARADLAHLLAETGADTWFVGHFGPVTRRSVAAFVDRASAP